MSDERWVTVTEAHWAKLDRVVRAAVVYCNETNPDDVDIDVELRAAVGALLQAGDE